MTRLGDLYIDVTQVYYPLSIANLTKMLYPIADEIIIHSRWPFTHCPKLDRLFYPIRA
jgi:hypothetical protein